MSECSGAREQSQQGGASKRVSGASERTSVWPSNLFWGFGWSGLHFKMGLSGQNQSLPNRLPYSYANFLINIAPLDLHNSLNCFIPRYTIYISCIHVRISTYEWIMAWFDQAEPRGPHQTRVNRQTRHPTPVKPIRSKWLIHPLIPSSFSGRTCDSK